MLKRFVAVLCFLLFAFNMVAYAEDISARSAVVIDGSSRDILFEKNAYMPMQMASTTKIMTCLLACENAKFDEIIAITDDMISGAYGSMIYLKVGDRISVFDLIQGAMLASGNDAANALAVICAGSVEAFISMMNDRARDIGMKDTLFVTPSGLDEGEHHSTAYDMALLSKEAIKNDTFSSICSKSNAEISINGKSQIIYNHNKLLGYDDGFVGVKTGFTEKAGRCLVSAYEYNDNVIITVTLNAPNDWDDHLRLVNNAKKKYNRFYNSYSVNVPLVGGINDIAKCSYSYDVYSLYEPTVKEYYYPFCYAPLNAGDEIGYADVYIKDEKILTVAITVSKDEKLWQITK